jgi:hypothetical protein
MAVDIVADYQNGFWHWRIIGPLDIGAAQEIATCCDDKGGLCLEFKTKAEAMKAGRRYAIKNNLN